MRTCVGSGLLWVCAAASWAIINPNFTPRDLVGQADLVVSAGVKATGNPLEWTLATDKAIKGKAPGEQVVDLAKCDKDHLEEIRQALKACAEERQPAVLFAGAAAEKKDAYLHVAGQWLAARPAADRRWEITGPAPQMVGTYAGGTDMLARMAEYLAREPDASVPVSAGVRWLAHARVGKVDGEIGGMEVVEIGGPRRTLLFVASSAGDRLYAPKKDEEALEDVTAKAGLDSRSRAFLWLDVNQDGLADLVTWDGSTLSLRLATREGTFKATAEAWTFRPQAPCIGLAACASRGAPAVLLSTDGLPILLVAEPAGWRPASLPDGPAAKESLGGHSPCVVADLDNDAFADILLPAERSGILWRGAAAGFEAPVRTNVSAGEGVAIAALGDFNGDGALDIFFAGSTRNSLWESDGRGRFTEVMRFGGSLGYKCPSHALAVRVLDLNHDGLPDLALGYEGAEFLYHFNRGFRSFGEEGEVRLPGPAAEPGRERPGQRALAAGDLNQDGSQDLAVLFTDGELYCYFNDRADVPGLCLRLPKGMTGPVTASCWVGPKAPVCAGVASVAGHTPGSYVAVRRPGEVTVRFRLPGAAERSLAVTVGEGPKDVILSAEGSQ